MPTTHVTVVGAKAAEGSEAGVGAAVGLEVARLQRRMTKSGIEGMGPWHVAPCVQAAAAKRGIHYRRN